MLDIKNASECWRLLPDSAGLILKTISEDKRLALAAASLNFGKPAFASALLDLPGSKHPHFRHRREILSARVAAARGKWQETEKLLTAWKMNPDRQEGSGEILFWLGWSALHQGKRIDADSLFMLSSAYAEESASQLALEYRLAGLLDSGTSLLAFIRGLPESPRGMAERILSLESVSAQSPLYPQALWEKACGLEKNGSSDSALKIFEILSRDLSTLTGRKAADRFAYLTESTNPDSALAAYERLLMEYQQGVRAEFARGRIRALRIRKANP